MNMVSPVSTKSPVSGDAGNILAKHYPEMRVGGYSAVDGTVEFYSRVNSLLDKDMTVLDFGAGRGAWFEDGASTYKKSLRLLKGKVRKVIVCDVDSIVFENNTADVALQCEDGVPLDVQDNSVDIVIADYVFEHVTNPDWLSSEFGRILKPGGWICSRTPCKFNYVAILAGSIPNRLHGKWLRNIQPTRKELDVFPTRYRLNTKAAIDKAFPEDSFDNVTYYFSGEPAYHFNSSIVLRLLQFFAWIAPKPLHANLFIFLRKRD